jgi:hypothetical protein
MWIKKSFLTGAVGAADTSPLSAIAELISWLMSGGWHCCFYEESTAAGAWRVRTAARERGATDDLITWRCFILQTGQINSCGSAISGGGMAAVIGGKARPWLGDCDLRESRNAGF